MSDALRAPRDEDMPIVVELMSTSAPDPVDEETVRLRWSSPNIDRVQDARIGPGCYAHLDGLDGERVWLDISGRPTEALLEWAETRAAEKGRRVLAGAWSGDKDLASALQGREFRLVRYAHRMGIDLEQLPPPATWPDGVIVRSFESGDEHAFYELHQETFVDTWEHVSTSFEEWRHFLLNPPRFVPELWFLALAGDEPAGIAICYPKPADPELGWIAIVGVRRSARRRGLGRALLLHAFSEFRRRGLSRAGLGVDAESLTGAHRLYESAGMQVVSRFDVYEKELA